MSLKIYHQLLDTAYLGTRDDGTYYLSFSFRGDSGGRLEKRLWLRNDSLYSYFTGITVDSTDTATLSISDGERTGYSVKLWVGDIRPTEEDWNSVSTGNQISLPNIGSSTNPATNSFVPFWVRVDVPANSDLETITTVSLQVNCTAFWTRT